MRQARLPSIPEKPIAPTVEEGERLVRTARPPVSASSSPSRAHSPIMAKARKSSIVAYWGRWSL